MRSTAVLICLIAQFFYVDSTRVRCESIGSCSTSDDHNDVCCIMTERTSINSSRFTVESVKNGDVQALDFNNNKNIEFLPIKVSLTFPHIVELDARNCSIQNISKMNFDRLHYLKLVYLQGNQIETISSDTFDNLNNIEDIDLADNRIARLNGQFFEGLPLLIYVNLNGNECINEHFLTKERIQLLPDVVNEKCFFDGEPQREIPVTRPPIRNLLKLKYIRRDEFVWD